MFGNKAPALRRAVARVCAVAALATFAAVAVGGTASAEPVDVEVSIGYPFPGATDGWHRGEPCWWDRQQDSEWDRYPGRPGGWWADPFPRGYHRGPANPFMYTGSFGSS